MDNTQGIYNKMNDIESSNKLFASLKIALDLIKKLLGRNAEDGIKETLEDILEQHDDRLTPIDADERHLINNILHAGQKTVKDVMIVRSEISAVNVNMTLRDAVELMVERPHSRYPVYNDNLDNVIGMVHIKDVLSALVREQKSGLNDLMRPVMIVVPSMPMMDLMLKMRIEKKHLAMVIDEFGGTDGIITIEDVVEEIIGEIEDEYDISQSDMFVPDDNSGATIDARYELDLLKDKIEFSLSEEERKEDIDTIGGLIVHILGRVPTRGEVVLHEHTGLELEIKDSDPRRVNQIYIRNINAK